MIFENWKYYKSPTGENIGITHTQDNRQESRLLTDPDVLEWLSEGNTPTPADE